MTKRVEHKLVHISLNKDGTVTKVINLHCVNHLKIQHTTSHQFAVDRSIDYASWRDPHALDFPHSVKGFLIFCDHRKIRAETMIDTAAQDNDTIINADLGVQQTQSSGGHDVASLVQLQLLRELKESKKGDGGS